MEDNRNLVVDKSSAKKHKRKLKAIISEFWRFLESKPKPSDEKVRSEFQRREIEWKAYCIYNNLDIRTSMMFNAKVSYEWELRRMEKSA